MNSRVKEMDARALQVLVVADSIFMKYGIKSISMDDITREMRISKKTLYRFFSNKADLLDRVLRYRFSRFINLVEATKHENRNAIDDLLGFSKAIDKHFRSIDRTFTLDLQKYYPQLYKESLERIRNFAYGLIMANIRKGIGEGLYRTDLNIDLVSRLYGSKLEDLQRPDYFADGAVEPEEIFRVMFENHVRGIANKKGIGYFEQQLENARH